VEQTKILNQQYINKFDRVIQIFIILFVLGSPFSITITQVSLTIALLAWATRMFYQRKFDVQSTPLDYIFLAYLIFETSSMIFSPEPMKALQNFKRMLLIPIVYLIASNVKEVKFARKLILVLISVTFAMSCYGIYKYLSGVGGLEGRLRLFHHWMTSGAILMIIGLMTLAFLFTRIPRKYLIYLLIAIIPILLSLIFTFTRSSWLGFAGGIFIMGLLRARKIIIPLTVLGIIAVFLAPAGIQDRVRSIVDPTHVNNIERLNMWQSGIAMIKDRPLTGFGDIDLGEIYQQYKLPNAKENVGHLHNNFVHIGAILGIPGIIVLLSLMIIAFIKELQIYLKISKDDWFKQGLSLGSIAVLIGFNINGLFDWNFGDAETVMLFWFSMGICFALPFLNENEKVTS